MSAQAKVLPFPTAQAPEPVSRPRPFRTFYFGPQAKETEWSHRGSAGTRKGAVIAAMRWIIERRADSAIIHGEDGAVCARVSRQPRGRILVIGV